jgi:hypothetical protein
MYSSFLLQWHMPCPTVLIISSFWVSVNPWQAGHCPASTYKGVPRALAPELLRRDSARLYRCHNLVMMFTHAMGSSLHRLCP